MNYRKAKLLASQDASTAKTEPIDITLKEVISRIQIKFNGTNTDTIPTAVHAKQITKVEIVDGSTVLWSLSGQQIEGKMFYDYKNGPSYEREFRNGVDNYLTLDILFGRKLWDKQLAFDPKRFNNPQLKITHNKALGGSLPNAATLEVFADVFDEKPVSPTGFIRATENYSFTSAASAAFEYIKLPTDMVFKRIMLQTYKADYWWENLVTSIKIDENSGAKVPLDIDGGDLVSLVQTEYGEYKELVVTPIRTTETLYVTPTESCHAYCSPIAAGAGAFCLTTAERTGGYQDFNANSTLVVRMLIAGYLPHGCLPIDFGDQMDIDDWYDVRGKGSVQLIPKANGSATFNVILEQLRNY